MATSTNAIGRSIASEKRFLILAFYILSVDLLGLPSISLAFPTGAPRDACQSLTPNHGGPQAILPRSTPNPYFLAVDTVHSAQGTYVRGVISGTSPFQGFMVQARPIDSNLAVGKFIWYSKEDVKPMTCIHANDTLTHPNTNKKEKVAFIWYAEDIPSNIKAIHFIATVAKSYAEFWTNITSDPIILGTTNTVLATTPRATEHKVLPHGLNWNQENTDPQHKVEMRPNENHDQQHQGWNEPNQQDHSHFQQHSGNQHNPQQQLPREDSRVPPRTDMWQPPPRQDSRVPPRTDMWQPPPRQQNRWQQHQQHTPMFPPPRQQQTFPPRSDQNLPAVLGRGRPPIIWSGQPMFITSSRRVPQSLPPQVSRSRNQQAANDWNNPMPATMWNGDDFAFTMNGNSPTWKLDGPRRVLWVG